jgi:amino acid transporter
MDKRVRLSAPGLMAMVVGSMVGVGVFSLPQALGKYTGVIGSLISWTITGSGMLILALIFQRLAALAVHRGAARRGGCVRGSYAQAVCGLRLP